jgi:hypothetical protein
MVGKSLLIGEKLWTALWAKSGKKKALFARFFVARVGDSYEKGPMKFAAHQPAS